jgi:hypothetical protein
MATIIVVGSIVLAVAYALLWWARPALRRQIEAPGLKFAADAKRYDSDRNAVESRNEERGKTHAD